MATGKITQIIGAVIDVQELAPRPARPPDLHLGGAGSYGFVHLADQSRQNV